MHHLGKTNKGGWKLSAVIRAVDIQKHEPKSQGQPSGGFYITVVSILGLCSVFPHFIFCVFFKTINQEIS